MTTPVAVSVGRAPAQRQSAGNAGALAPLFRLPGCWTRHVSARDCAAVRSARGRGTRSILCRGLEDATPLMFFRLEARRYAQ